MFYLHTYSNLHTLTSNKLHLSTECLATPPRRDNKCPARPPSRFSLSRLLRGKESKTGRRWGEVVSMIDYWDWSERSRSIGRSIKGNDRLSFIRWWSDFEGISRNSWGRERHEIEAESMSEAKCSNVSENANANFTLMATKNSKNYLIKTTSMSVGLSKT